MARDDLGSARVRIEPDLDQAALRAQLAKIKSPTITLKPKIRTIDVNKEIARVNKTKIAAIKVPIKFDQRQVNRELKRLGAVIRAETRASGKDQLKVDKDVLAARRTQWVNAARNRRDIEKNFINEQRNLWQNAARIQRRIDSDLYKSLRRNRQGLILTLGKLRRITESFNVSLGSLLRFLSISKPFAMIGILGILAQALSSALAGVTALTAALGFSLGTFIALPAAITAGAQALAVFKFATVDVGKAIKGLNDRIDPKVFAKLTPAAKQFVTTLDSLKPSIRGFQQEVQQGLFGGLSDAIKVFEPLLLALRPALIQTAEIMGALGEQAAGTAFQVRNKLVRALVVNNFIIQQLGKTAIQLSVAYLNILQAAEPLIETMFNGLRAWAETKRAMTDNALASGKLASFFDRARESASALLDLVGTTSRALGNIFAGALPSGLRLLDLLNQSADRLEAFTGSAGGQNAIRKFFADAEPALLEVGRLISAISRGFLGLASNNELAGILVQVRTVILPALQEIFREFVPVVVPAIGAFINLMSDLVGVGGPISNFVKILTGFAVAAHKLFEQNPQLATFIGDFIVFSAAINGLKLFTVVSGLAGLTKGLFALALGEQAAAVASAELAVSAGGLRLALLALVTGPGAIIVGSIIAIGAAFKYAYDNSELFRQACAKISQAATDMVPGLQLGLENLSNLILKMQGVEDQAKELQGGAITRSIQKLKQGLQGPLFGPPVPKRNTQVDALRAQLKSLQSIRKIDTINANAEAEASKRQTEANKRLQETIKGMRLALQPLEERLNIQKKSVEALSNALSELRSIQLAGTQAFSDQSFAIEQQIKALQLQQTDLQIGGLTSESGPVVELQKQIDALQLQAQKVDLTESLKLDPLRRAWEKVLNPVKELSFDSAVTQFKNLTAQHTIQTASLAKLQAAYDKVQQGIQKLEQGGKVSIQNLTRTINQAMMQTQANAITTGSHLITGLSDGIKQSQQTILLPTLKGVSQYIIDNKGPVSADRQMLVPAGIAIMEGLNEGLGKGFNGVKSLIGKVGPAIADQVPESVFSKRTAQFLVEVAAGNKPNAEDFFADLLPSAQSIDFGPLSGASNPFVAFESLFGLRRSSGDHDAPGVHAAGSFHYRKAPWGGVQAYDYGDALNPVFKLKQAAAWALQHASLFAESFYDKMSGYVDNGRVIHGVFGGHGDHLHAAFKVGFKSALGELTGGAGGAFSMIFAAAAKAFNIPAALLKAVTQAESNFNPSAHNASGASGLMQLLPGTFAAQHVGGSIFDPRSNIFAGAKYLSSQIKAFGSIPLALAAYNAGPGNVSRFGGIPPFSETIEYVRKILASIAKFGGFRAAGGPVSHGSSYIVGERGPELFTPGRSGSITPNHQLNKAMTFAPVYNVQTASNDPSVILALLEARDRRALRQVAI